MYDRYFFHLAISEFENDDNPMFFCRKCGEAYMLKNGINSKKIPRCGCTFGRRERKCFRGRYIVTGKPSDQNYILGSLKSSKSRDAYIIKIYPSEDVIKYAKIRYLDEHYIIPFYFNKNIGMYCVYKFNVYVSRTHKIVEKKKAKEFLEFLFPPF